jgi:CRP/FNR family transcriptional regulator, cyclic AMP receptor protein
MTPLKVIPADANGKRGGRPMHTMNFTFGLGTMLGLLGVLFCFASFIMKSMVSLRVLALVSNVCFMAYGCVESQLPSLVLNGALLPVNARRLWEIKKLSKEIARASEDSPVSQWLLPHMRRRTFKAGEVVFRKGDLAEALIYVASGGLKLTEIEQPVGPGELVGEIGLFSPDKTRTQTMVCETDGELYEMTDEMIFQLYYQNPKLGFYLMRLVAGRLLADVRRRDVAGTPA